MRSKIKYDVSRLSFDYETKKYNTTIDSRSAMFEIYGKTEEEAQANFDSFYDYLNEQTDYYQFSTCPSIVEVKDNLYCYTEYIGVSDKDEYNELKEIYMDWKKSVKENKAEKTETNNSEPVKVEQNAQTENTEVVYNTTETIAPIKVDEVEENTNTENQDQCITEQSQSFSNDMALLGKKVQWTARNATNSITMTGVIIDINMDGTIIHVENEEDIYMVSIKDITIIENSENEKLEKPKTSITETKPEHRGKTVQNYRIFLEPNKEYITANSILRIDLFNSTNLQDIQELENWEYKIKDSFKNTFYIIPTKLKNIELSS